MAKKRSLDIDKLLFDTEIMKTLTIKGILLYQVLWGHADDWGGVELDIENLSLRTGALKMSIKEVEKEIIKLTNGLKKIIPYIIENKNYGWIKNFFKHQRLNNPSMPTLPLPEWVTYEIKTYPSGKKWASYTVIPEKIPVDYQYTTSKSDTIPIDTIPIDTDTIPPDIKDVLSYCQERKSNVSAKDWYNHYQAKGWVIGKTKMVDWKAAVRTWEKNSAGTQPIGRKP